ncbi:MULTISPECIES: hypothetical protein [unclassified Lysobacter]|uniref:hypothetical protein n=1 Tax=unclassified Lysobacter TaxID=2635362 RepID=UPI001BED2A29|nr:MULTISPECIES: hypothetical protein [unclassified Lysobacter]MBT2750144.1 hypothetical protein [Lysobacter sp. ISL-50]MBT2782658.1 hypothetical protein [Lysobacter sp. ISL-52]
MGVADGACRPAQLDLAAIAGVVEHGANAALRAGAGVFQPCINPSGAVRPAMA